jgi:vacuolar-type H+-ATPase subunit C/Vma6
MTTWDDLNARSRGLATHLLGRLVLERLAHLAELPSVAAELAHQGYQTDESARVTAVDLELAARRVVARRLRVLLRWAGPRTEALGVVFEDEDRRSIKALLRGAVQRAPAELRVSGLLPTPALPERALEELSRQPSTGAVAALLSTWRHPLAPALLPEATRPEPDLLRLEISLHRTFAERALRAAQRTGRQSVLTHYVRRVIDLENAFTALVLSEEKDSRLAEFWLPGGEDLTTTLAERAVATASLSAASRTVAQAFVGTRLQAVFRDAGADPASLEVAVLRALIAELKERARLDPLSPAFLLGYALRLRAEVLDIRRVVWGISLGAPIATRVEGLATAP